VDEGERGGSKSESGNGNEAGKGGGAEKPLQRYKPHKHWVELRSNPLHKPLQSATEASGLVCPFARGDVEFTAFEVFDDHVDGAFDRAEIFVDDF